MIVHINTHMNIHVQHRCSSCGEVLYISPMDAIMYAPGYMYACRVHYRGIRMCVCVCIMCLCIENFLNLAPNSCKAQRLWPSLTQITNSEHCQKQTCKQTGLDHLSGLLAVGEGCSNKTMRIKQPENKTQPTRRTNAVRQV